MTDPASPGIILLDIEGTVAPISFVHEVLFPYARQQMETYLRQHWNSQPVATARALLEQNPGDFSEQSLAALKAKLFEMMDADAKSTGLKLLQGLIWDQGYRAGHFRSPVFADVPPALARWKQSGKTIAIYSSGSVAAQRVFFQHTTAGDLTPYLSAFFDTTTGPKRSASSFTAIAAALGSDPARVLFISDVVEEIEAATAAGMRGMIAVRPGNKPIAPTAFSVVASFDGQF